MAFENVDVGSLRSAINTSINNLNNNLSYVSSSITNSMVWQCDAKNTLKNALDKLQNTRYKELKDKLDKYKNIPNLIEEYQKLKKENENLRNTNNSLNGRLYRTVTDYRTEYDEYGNRHEVASGTRQEIDYGVQNQINSNNNTINNNVNRMKQLENQVASSI